VEPSWCRRKEGRGGEGSGEPREHTEPDTIDSVEDSGEGVAYGEHFDGHDREHDHEHMIRNPTMTEV
jgi:hypothetical protein